MCEARIRLTGVLLGITVAIAQAVPRNLGAGLESGFSSSERCPETCSSLFGKIETDEFGNNVQDILMKERGEPKSGTSFMFQWGEGAIQRFCLLLNDLYGQYSCEARWEENGTFGFVFEPPKGGQGDIAAPCSCEDVDRVHVALSMKGKHMLPVNDDCPWQHPISIAEAWGPFGGLNKGKPEDFQDIRRTILGSGCTITEDLPQMVVFRDPRPMSVSSYFHSVIYRWKDPSSHGTVDQYVQEMFPVFCHWLAVRHVLFTEMMASQSTTFWYQDALDHPEEWHRRWFESMGLRPPKGLIRQAAESAVEGKFAFQALGRNEHPGGEAAKPNRSYEDELRAETLSAFDSIMRTWLPPEMLEILDM